MNTSLIGVVAVVLAAGLWLAGRRPRPLLTNTDTQKVAALNRAQNTLVWEARQMLQDAPAKPEGAGVLLWSPQATLGTRPEPRMPAHERRNWLRELNRHYQAGGGQRLEAMRLARAWGHRDVLPLLQQGLRDPDPRVMREAALAMEAFRAKPILRAARTQAPAAAPRKVARTR